MPPDSEDPTAVVAGLTQSAPATGEYRRHPRRDKARWRAVIGGWITGERGFRRIRGMGLPMRITGAAPLASRMQTDRAPGVECSAIVKPNLHRGDIRTSIIPFVGNRGSVG